MPNSVVVWSTELLVMFFFIIQNAIESNFSVVTDCIVHIELIGQKMEIIAINNLCVQVHT